MTDNELFIQLRMLIVAGLAARGFLGFSVARNYQTLQQGANTAPTIYLFKLSDRRHGSPQQSYAWSQTLDLEVVTESQVYETTFQIGVELLETTDPAGFTPSDVVNAVAAIMQADAVLAELHEQGVGVLRVGDVRNPYFVNDRNQFDAEASFDLVLTYRRNWVSSAPVVAEFAGLNIVRVPDVPPTVRTTDDGDLRITGDGFTLRIGAEG